MDWGTLVVGAVGTVIGGAVAAGTGWLQARAQRKWAKDDLAAHLAAERDREVRVRADERAVNVLMKLNELQQLIDHRTPILSVYLWSMEVRDEAKAILANILLESTFLRDPVRRHVANVTELLPEADQLLGERWIHESPRAFARNVINDASEALGNYLRGEPVSVESSDVVRGYLNAKVELDQYIDAQLERQIAEAEAAAADEETGGS